MITAHRIFDYALISRMGIAFIAFSTCASAVYLLNDIFDREADRAHPLKKTRPIASGELPVSYAILMIGVLGMFAAGLSLNVSYSFAAVLACYALLTTLYTISLKQVVLVDIITLSLLYAVRVMAGGVAAEVPVSQWLVGFSLFIFLSLACVKRFSELRTIRLGERDKAHRRGYQSDDLELVAQFGVSTGCVAVLVFALYITSADVAVLYRTPEVLWLMCPVLLYWISRLWLLAHRGEVHEDPILFAIRDRVSYCVGLISLLVIGFAA
jgi:4-hydroxybenzoate polyprenyltransferase